MDTHQLEGRSVLYRLLHRQECETIGGLGQGHYLLSQHKLICTGAGTTHREVHVVHLLRPRGGPSHCLGKDKLAEQSVCLHRNAEYQWRVRVRGVKEGDGCYLAKSSTHP